MHPLTWRVFIAEPLYELTSLKSGGQRRVDQRPGFRAFPVHRADHAQHFLALRVVEDGRGQHTGCVGKAEAVIRIGIGFEMRQIMFIAKLLQQQVQDVWLHWMQNVI